MAYLPGTDVVADFTRRLCVGRRPGSRPREYRSVPATRLPGDADRVTWETDVSADSATHTQVAGTDSTGLSGPGDRTEGQRGRTLPLQTFEEGRGGVPVGCDWQCDSSSKDRSGSRSANTRYRLSSGSS